MSKGPDTKILAALEGLLWPIAAEEDATAGFDGKGHDDLVDRLRRTIENTLGSSVRVSVLQSLEDAGCDILIETAQAGPKYGIQLKSHFDISEKGFGGKVSAQVQDSRQHDLQRLFVVLAGDLTSRSQIQKVRGLESRFSKMNDKYAMVVPPEQAWTLLCAPKRAPAPLTPHFAHAYPLQPNFTGRVKERKRLTEWLTQDDQPVLALVAFGGMGKSALAWAWLLRDVLGLPLPGAVADSAKDAEACRVPENVRPEGAFWWSFYEKDSTFEGFLDQALAYAAAGQIPAGVVGAYEKMEALVKLLREKRLLLVLDGFERQLRQYASMEAVYQKDDEEKVPAHDRACADPNAAAFLKRLAGGPFKSHVLLTSRLLPRELEGDDGRALANCRLEKLESMDRGDAVAFFHSEGVKGTRAEIEAACRPYGYQPLALRLLAGVIVKDNRMPGDIKAAERHGLLKEKKGDKLRRMLKAAYDALDSRTRGLLSQIAAFRSGVDYDTISVLKTAKNEQRFDGALDELTERGLLLREGVDAPFDLHPLVRAYAYKRLRDKKRVHERLAKHFADIPVPGEEDFESVEDLAPVIELYHHTVGAGRYDEAREVYRDRLSTTLYYQFGAYQTCIELLRALFPNGEGSPPRLQDQGAQAFTFASLANSYSVSGQSRQAVPLFERQIAIRHKQGDKRNLAIGYLNLANDEVRLGALADGVSHSRKGTELSREVGYEFGEAIGHHELGRMLAYPGQFDEAERELIQAEGYWERTGDKQGSCLVESYRALAALMAGDAEAALDHAREAHGIAIRRQNELDRVRAEWLIGAAQVPLAPSTDQRDERLAEAEAHLNEALSRCRRINLVEFEPDILLSWARWHRAKGHRDAALEQVHEALSIADRCEYRLVQADVHNFLAALEMEGDDRETATEHATTGYERAWCDGPPHAYQPALDEAKRLLDELGVEPPEMPAYVGE